MPNPESTVIRASLTNIASDLLIQRDLHPEWSSDRVWQYCLQKIQEELDRIERSFSGYNKRQPGNPG